MTPPLLDGIIICAHFEEGILREAIHIFKYNFIFDIGNFLGEIMERKLLLLCCRGTLQCAPTEFDLIIPIPLHKKRLRERGFNQAEILAKIICRDTPRQYGGQARRVSMGILKRVKYTIPQAELSRKERLVNLKGAFEFMGPDLQRRGFPDVEGRDILLVDDITTTGATLEECAKVLKKEGAGSVWGIVLGKG